MNTSYSPRTATIRIFPWFMVLAAAGILFVLGWAVANDQLTLFWLAVISIALGVMVFFGEAVSLAFDQDRGVAILTQRRVWRVRRREIPFDEVHAVAVDESKSSDGSGATYRALIVLKSGERVPLTNLLIAGRRGAERLVKQLAEQLSQSRFTPIEPALDGKVRVAQEGETAGVPWQVEMFTANDNTPVTRWFSIDDRLPDGFLLLVPAAQRRETGGDAHRRIDGLGRALHVSPVFEDVVLAAGRSARPRSSRDAAQYRGTTRGALHGVDEQCHGSGRMVEHRRERVIARLAAAQSVEDQRRSRHALRRDHAARTVGDLLPQLLSNRRHRRDRAVGRAADSSTSQIITRRLIMFSSLRKVVPLLLVALLIGACSNSPAGTTVPLVPIATLAATSASQSATAEPTQPPAPKSTAAPTETPAPTATAAPATGATCLVGTWKIADMSDYFASVMSQADNIAAIVGQNGRLLYTFTPDGQATVKAEAFQEIIELTTQGIKLEMILTVDGEAASTYTSTPDTFTFAGTDNSVFKLSATLNGQEMFSDTTPDEMAAAFGVSNDPKYNTSAYECAGDTLKITPPVQNARAIVFQRDTQ